MRGRGFIVWVVVPFNGAKDESKVGRSFDFLSLSSSLYRIFHSRFWFLSNRGDLVMSSVKVIIDDKPVSEYVGKIELCEDVKISGKKDATDTLIRQSLDDSTGLEKRVSETTKMTDWYTCVDHGRR